MPMPMFITRVELHNAKEADYDNLHEQMEARGFSRNLPDKTGKLRRLPTAEYFRQVDATIEEVAEDADLAANATRKPSSILVTEAKQLRANRLQPVPKNNQS